MRLLGIRTSKLLPEDTPVQLSLFDESFTLRREDSDKQKKLDQAVDEIRRRFGDRAVIRGSLLQTEEKTRRNPQYTEHS